MTYSANSNGQWFQNGIRVGITTDSTFVLNPGNKALLDFPVFITPLAASANNIALAQTLANAGAVALTAGVGATVGSIAGLSVILLDNSRKIVLTGALTTTLAHITINGFDQYNQKVTSTFAGPIGSTTTLSPKTFKAIYSITADAGTTGDIIVGTSDVVALPYTALKAQYVQVAWNNGNVAYTSVTAADQTTPATAITGDVYGSVTLPSSSDGTLELAGRILGKAVLPTSSSQVQTQITGISQFASF